MFDPDGAVPRIGATLSQLSSGASLWDPRMVTGVPTLAHGSLTPFAPDVLVGLVAGPFVGFDRPAGSWPSWPGSGCTASCARRLGPPPDRSLHPRRDAVPVLVLALHLRVRRGRRAARVLGGRSDGYYPTILTAPLLVGVGAIVLGTYAGLSQIVILAGGLNLAWILIGSRAGTLRARAGAWLLDLGPWLRRVSPGPAGPGGIAAHLGPVDASRDIDYLYETRPIPALIEHLQLYSATILGIPIGSGLGQSPLYYGTYFTGAIGLLCIGATVLLGLCKPAARFAILMLVAIPVLDLVITVLMPALAPLGTLQTFQFIRIRHLFPFVLALAAAIGAFCLMAVARWHAARPAGWSRGSSSRSAHSSERRPSSP